MSIIKEFVKLEDGRVCQIRSEYLVGGYTYYLGVLENGDAINFEPTAIEKITAISGADNFSYWEKYWSENVKQIEI